MPGVIICNNNKKSMKLILKSIIIITLFVGSVVFANDITSPISPGQLAPAVELRDAEGTDVNLRAIIKNKPSVIVFYRGGWCPFCNKHLMGLAGIIDELKAANYQLLAISPDQPSKIEQTPDRDKFDYTLFSDSEMKAAKAFRVDFKVPDELVANYKSKLQIDLVAASGQTHHLLPHPSVFIVDAKGVVRFTHMNPDYKNRLDPTAILKAAKANATP